MNSRWRETTDWCRAARETPRLLALLGIGAHEPCLAWVVQAVDGRRVRARDPGPHIQRRREDVVRIDPWLLCQTRDRPVGERLDQLVNIADGPIPGGAGAPVP